MDRSNTDSIKQICSMLKDGVGSMPEKYYVPEAWNTWGFARFTNIPGRNGEIMVDPYDFYSDCIVNGILAAGNGTAAVQTIDPARLTIYSMLPRAATAWDHYERGRLLPGTFLKTLCLLPYLHSMGINVVYLLPVFSGSDRYRKGEIGSPYSIKNIYKINRSLHDPLLGNYSQELLDTQFKAFTQACHLLGIRVMVDFAFRTVSRDNDLIIEHPDWFYWIDVKYAATIAAPAIGRPGRTGGPIPLNDSTIELLYSMNETKEYLKKFVYSPDKIDPERWEKIKTAHFKTGENILDMIEDEFGITTLPGFSDVINDSQPPWTDVTYLRYYFDVSGKTEKFLSQDQPPYIMQDGVCLRLYPGKTENRKLMEYISGVIPYYQNKYSIDGARIDMGHALTPVLNRDIISNAKKINSGFIFWSEEFDPAKSGEAGENGFHFINGTIWSVYKDITKSVFNKKLIRDMLLKSRLPVIASAETPDTPRAAWVFKDRRILEQLIFINCLLPNSVQFINNGFDLMEIQPMNLGLDNSEQGRCVLNRDDPMYGRLAFFDNYRMHWLNEGREWIKRLLLISARLRRRYIDIICHKENFIDNPFVYKGSKLTVLLYSNRVRVKREGCKGVFLLANRNFSRDVYLRTSALLAQMREIHKGRVRCEDNTIYIVFSTKLEKYADPCLVQDTCFTEGDCLVKGDYFIRKVIHSGKICLSPGEVIIGEVNHEEA